MAVGLIAGGWVASAVISKLINELVDYAKNKKNKLGLKEVNLEEIKRGLPKIKAVLINVDQGMIRELNEPLEEWLWQLRDAADQADDVMDEMEYYVVKKKVQTKNKVSAVKIFLECLGEKKDTLEKLKEAVKAINDVLADVNNFNMIVRDLVETQKGKAIENCQTSSFLNVGFKTYGRVEEKQDIVSKLLKPVCKSEKVNFSVLPIVGAAGIGKTTLAQLVYNDPEVKKYFELRMWVCVSNNFDVFELTKKLYESAFNHRADFDNLDTVQKNLSEKLIFTRFLVVLDDVWNNVDRFRWEMLVAPLKFGKSGSMILLTTRLKEVATITGANLMDPFNLIGLNEADMWHLFEECAFNGQDPRKHNQLVKIGRDILKKLKGFPLAAKTVGGILCRELTETHWRKIMQSELWDLEQGPNDIMPALRLTYQYLPSHLKSCFSFCSIFPQDHIFIKDDLINMWVALGLVPRDFNGPKRPEDVGSEYFEDMLNRSIFSLANPIRNTHLRYPAYTYYSITGHKFVDGYIMHDLMHDLSIYVSRGECFTYYTDKSESIPPTVRHLYVCVGACCELSNFNLENIRTLVLHFEDSNHPKLDYIVNEVVKRTKSLRILALFALKLSEFPKSASDLLHLRYLSLSSFNIKEYPVSLSKLYFLETMVCGGFGIEKPSQAAGLVELINLRHLIVSEAFVETIAGISRLTSLQELCCRVAKSSGFKICELKDMRDLRRLSISNVGGIASYEEAIEANLGNKVNLSKLSLQWEADNLDKNVFEHLEPHCNLKELKIRNYMGESLPPWLTRLAFSNLEVLIFESMRAIREWSPTEQPNNCMQCLRELTIDDCPDLLFLPPLPASLKKLILRGLGLFHLPDLLKDHTSKSGMLPSLVSIEISECPNLSSFELGFLQNPEQFTSLEELIIMNCEELETPPDGFSKYISLKRLDISDCPQIKLSFVDRFSLSSTLQFFRIDNHVEDIEAEMRHEDNAHESHLQSVPTLQTEEAKLVVFDLSQSFPKLELRFSSMRSYMGRGSLDWLTQNLPHLEYLNIDGYPRFNEYYTEKLPEEVNHLMRIICQGESTSCPDISKIQMVQQIYLVTENIKGIQYLKRLSVAIRSSSWVMPHIPVTLKELRLSNLKLTDLKYLQQKYEKEVKIRVWKAIMNLSEEGFSKLDRGQAGGTRMLVVPECFLPSALKVLHVSNCSDLNANISKALEGVDSLISLVLDDCQNIRSLPPREVFSRWKTLERLEFSWCIELISLESLLGLTSVRLLKIASCPMLVSAITSLSPGKKDETEGIVEDGTIQTSNWPASTLPTPTDPSSSTNTEHKPLLSVGELEIDNPLLLYIEPIRSLSSVRKLTITRCSKMQSLPELPPIREELSLYNCSPELKRRCEESGEDWPKLSHIPEVFISEAFFSGWYSNSKKRRQMPTVSLYAVLIHTTKRNSASSHVGVLSVLDLVT